jgi:hypothetical protein
MPYNKPEVKTLGEATMVIEFIGRKTLLPLIEGFPPLLMMNPAYDLDD